MWQYNANGELYKSALKTAHSTLKTAIMPIQKVGMETVKKDFEEARTAIAKVVSIVPSADLLQVLPLIREGKLTETELQIITSAHQHNYLDAKLIYDAMGKGKEFKTVEHLMQELDSAEQMVNTFFNTYEGATIDKMGYRNAVVLNGQYFEALSELTDEFLSTYSEQNAE